MAATTRVCDGGPSRSSMFKAIGADIRRDNVLQRTSVS